MQNLPPPPPPAAAPSPDEDTSGRLTPSFVEAVQDALRRYAIFRGRSSRRSFWFFWLSYSVLVGLESGFLGTPFFQIGLILPMWAVAIRRMHDTSKSGWFLLVPLYSLYLACKRGDSSDNRFGPPPR